MRDSEGQAIPCNGGSDGSVRAMGKWFCGSDGSVWVMGEWSVGQWIVGVISF